MMATLNPEPEVEAREVLWPPSFASSPGARSPAYGLAALVVELAVAAAFDTFYWADSNWSRPGVMGWVIAVMALPILLMCGTLASAVTGQRSRSRVLQQGLAALAWVVSAVASLLLLLIVWGSSADLCEMTAPPVPAYLDPVLMVPVCLAAALGIGSLISRAAWVITHSRIRHVTLYAIWLMSVAAALVLLLAPVLSNSPTCAPLRA